MSWKVPLRTGGAATKAPPGMHPAVLVALIDLGTQNEPYQGKPRWVPRIAMGWELVEEPPQGTPPLPVVAVRMVTVSMDEKANLRLMIESRMGRQLDKPDEYDITQELGKPSLLNVVQDGEYTKVATVGQVPRGMTVKPPSVIPFMWRIDQWDDKTPPVIPAWMPWLMGMSPVEKIRLSRELQRTRSTPF